MASRRLALVIASQCEARPEFSFLPVGHDVVAAVSADRGLVVELAGLLTHPAVGGCDPVAVDDPEVWSPADGLVANPTAAQANRALLAAINDAAEREATLLVHVVAHGSVYKDRKDGRRHLLHMRNTVGDPVDTGEESHGWDPYELIDERFEHVRGHLAGLVLIVDACYASTATPRVQWWADASGELRTVWIGSSLTQPAYDGCFTRQLCEVLRHGLDRSQHPHRSLVTQLRAVDVVPVIEKRCQGQRPVVAGFQDHDPAMFLAANRAADRLLDQLGLPPREGELLIRLVKDFQDTSDCTRILDVAERRRRTVVQGPAGSGKTVLAAALRYPPEPGSRRVDAVASPAPIPTLRPSRQRSTGSYAPTR